MENKMTGSVSDSGYSMYMKPSGKIAGELRQILPTYIEKIVISPKEQEEMDYCNLDKENLAGYYYDRDGNIYYDSNSQFYLKMNYFKRLYKKQNEQTLRVIFIWRECPAFDWALRKEARKPLEDAYYVEIPKRKMISKVKKLLVERNFHNPKTLENGEYYNEVNQFKKANPELVNENCAYVLVNKSVTKILLCNWTYPYSSQWNTWNPFEEVCEGNFNADFGIRINELNQIREIDKMLHQRTD
jgi:hypothetical protein